MQGLIESGRATPVIDRRYCLSEVPGGYPVFRRRPRAGESSHGPRIELRTFRQRRRKLTEFCYLRFGMKIQINSDKQITMDSNLRIVLEAELKRALERFEGRLTRIEVHLSDVNSSKPGLFDKHCAIEARPAGHKPVSVTHAAATVESATRGAAGKLKRLLDTSFGKVSAKGARETVRTQGSSVAWSRALKKLERLDAALSEMLQEPVADEPQIERHVQAATNALNKVRSIIESKPREGEGSGAVRRDAKKVSGAPMKKRDTTESVAQSGRSPKKKQVYRARRKAWPAR